MDTETLLITLKKEAARIDRAMHADLAEIESPLLSKVVRHAVFQGGKRVRPLLTVLSARLIGTPPDTISQLAVLFEYLHAASLLHDDVIDHSAMRRGKKTAHTIWGDTPVILAGDYLHARAMFLAGACGGPQCLVVVSRAISAMIEAEFLQMQTVQEKNTSETNYFRILQGKTAALIAAACETGMLHAGGSPAQCEAVRAYGTNLGLAFQIVDDLLDYQGDPGQTGKTVGNDFQEGKITLPLLHTLQRTGRDKRAFLEELLRKSPEKRRQALPRVQPLIAAAGGFAAARKKAEQLVAAAVQELHAFADSEARTTLQDLSRYVLTREK